MQNTIPSNGCTADDHKYLKLHPINQLRRRCSLRFTSALRYECGRCGVCVMMDLNGRKICWLVPSTFSSKIIKKKRKVSLLLSLYRR